MKRRLYQTLGHLCCTCWLTRRAWPWRIPLTPGRAGDGWFRHSLGVAAYTFESRVLCSPLMGWLWGE